MVVLYYAPVGARRGGTAEMGGEMKTIPSRVLLCAIGYHVAIADNMVLFSTEPGVAGCYTRMMFQRVYGCWYVTIVDSDEKVMVSHIEAANKLVCEWFGGNHNCPQGENVP